MENLSGAVEIALTDAKRKMHCDDVDLMRHRKAVSDLRLHIGGVISSLLSVLDDGCGMMPFLGFVGDAWSFEKERQEISYLIHRLAARMKQHEAKLQTLLDHFNELLGNIRRKLVKVEHRSNYQDMVLSVAAISLSLLRHSPDLLLF